MNTSGVATDVDDGYPGLHFMDGTESHSSYAVISRRGDIFLGIRVSGLTEGSLLGVPAKSYLHARVRSARSQKLAEQLDTENGAENVVNFSDQQLSLDAAWPNLSFDKVDSKRASLGIGLFIQGSLVDDAVAVVTRIEKADLFRKLVDYVIEQAGPENRIASARVASALSTELRQLAFPVEAHQ